VGRKSLLAAETGIAIARQTKGYERAKDLFEREWLLDGVAGQELARVVSLQADAS
jgi:hypothetical protein